MSVTFFCDSPLNIKTRLLRTPWHVPLVLVLTGFHCSMSYRSFSYTICNVEEISQSSVRRNVDYKSLFGRNHHFGCMPRGNVIRPGGTKGTERYHQCLYLCKEPSAKTNFIRSPSLLVFFRRLNSGNIGHQFWRAFKLIPGTFSEEDTVKPPYNEPLYTEVLFKFRGAWGTSHLGGISHFEQVFAKDWVRVVVSKCIVGLFWRSNFDPGSSATSQIKNNPVGQFN